MSYKVITAPTEEPVTLAQVKLQSKIDVTDEDALLNVFIQSAREQVEHRTGRPLVTQTLEVPFDAFPSSEIELPVSNVQSIASIQYIDANGSLQTVSSSNYSLDNYGIRNWILPNSGFAWPNTADTPNAVKIRLVAGYGAAAAVPSSLKIWILMAVDTMFNNRSAVATPMHQYELPRDFFDGLLDPYRIWRI